MALLVCLSQKGQCAYPCLLFLSESLFLYAGLRENDFNALVCFRIQGNLMSICHLRRWHEYLVVT